MAFGFPKLGTLFDCELLPPKGMGLLAKLN